MLAQRQDQPRDDPPDGGRHPHPALRWMLTLWPAVAAALLAVLAVSLYQGWVLTHPRRLPVTDNPATAASLEYRDLPCQNHISCGRRLYVPGVHLPLAGWVIPLNPGSNYPGSSGDWSQNTVVLVDDHGQSRTATGPFPLWGVVTVLDEMGYNVVLYDAEGTGQSGGAGIAFGTVEVRDLNTVVAWLKQQGPAQGHIAVWGLGSGADTAILAAAADPSIAAVIADSPYATVGTYLRRNIPRWTGLPAIPFGPTILWAMQVATGARYANYKPLTAIAALGETPGKPGRPLLLVAGQADAQTPPADVSALYKASQDNNAMSPLLVPGAGHLQAMADSAPSAVPGLGQYMCYALDTLAAMQQPGQSPEAVQRSTPCGGAAQKLRSSRPLPASVAGLSPAQ